MIIAGRSHTQYYKYRGGIRGRRQTLDTKIGLSQDLQYSGAQSTLLTNEDDNVSERHTDSQSILTREGEDIAEDQYSQGQKLDKAFETLVIFCDGTRSRSYRCKYCQSTFRHLSSVSRHVKLHFESSFSCEICGNSFRTKDYLRNHMRVHKKPSLPCNLCGMMFAHYIQRNRHMESYHRAGSRFQAQPDKQ